MKRVLIVALLAASFAGSAHAQHHRGGHHGHHHWGHHGWGWGGWWGPAVVGGVVVGGAITAAAIAEQRASAANLRRCALEFPSFEAKSGTYVNPDGVVRVCPYLY